jgi:hypothetical protein
VSGAPFGAAIRAPGKSRTRACARLDAAIGPVITPHDDEDGPHKAATLGPFVVRELGAERAVLTVESGNAVVVGEDICPDRSGIVADSETGSRAWAPAGLHCARCAVRPCTRVRHDVIELVLQNTDEPLPSRNLRNARVTPVPLRTLLARGGPAGPVRLGRPLALQVPPDPLALVAQLGQPRLVGPAAPPLPRRSIRSRRERDRCQPSSRE